MKWKPKVDKKRRLVATRCDISVNGSKLHLYQIWKITKTETIAKQKPFFAVTDQEFSKIKEFRNSKTGEVVKIAKSNFKTQSTRIDQFDVVEVFKMAK